MRTLVLIGFVSLAVLCFAWSSAAAPVGAPTWGKVTYEDGTPAAGAVVKWLSLDVGDGVITFKNRENEMVCGGDGAFRFEKMKKGPFRLEATGRPPGAKSDVFVVVPKVSEGTPNLKIVLKCGSSFTGHVVDTKGKAIPAFKIGAQQRYKLLGAKDKSNPTAASGPDPRAFKDEEGKFSFDCLPDGEWEVFIASGATQLSKPVTVTLPQTGDPIELVVPPMSEKQILTGRVVDPDGKPMGGADVHVVMKRDEKDTIDDRTTKTEKDGTFRFEKLHSWPYFVSASATGYGYSPYLQLDGTESAVEFVLTLRASCRLSGDVVDTSNQPVGDCTVMVTEENVPLSQYSPQTKSDAKGHFELADLPPGPNLVYGFTEEDHASGESGAAKRIVLTKDAPGTIKLKLRPPKK